MTAAEFDTWRRARKLDIHMSDAPGEIQLTAIRGKQVWTALAVTIDDAIELLQTAVDGGWKGSR